MLYIKFTHDLLKRFRGGYFTVNRYLTGLNLWNEELSSDVKHKIESHWSGEIKSESFNERDATKEKYYVLSMFPYPSGSLHMGHVRVYTISDAIARYQRLNGKNVIHPIGWDAFGLPAENAAIDRQIAPGEWTKQNISHMKQQLQQLGCSFEWDRELATCDPQYYKWTQDLFLKLYDAGLVYQKEALVNWDPIDQTVLADEQVDENGCSWRSGARVEKKLLRQWFVKTTKFARDLLDGLDDSVLHDWRDIIKVQRHWIGECDGVNLEFKLYKNNNHVGNLTLWTDRPEYVDRVKFVAIGTGNILARKEGKTTGETVKLDVELENAFNGERVPVYVTGDVEFLPGTDTFVGIPDVTDTATAFAEKHNIQFTTVPKLNTEEQVKQRQNAVLKKSRELKIGGYWTSAKLRDWLISRQRYWGTPIPVIHCPTCGTQPVPREDLPVKLPELSKLSKKGGSQLAELTEFIDTSCPKCGGSAKRETDTMDTFVDSSWYYLRYLDPKNDREMFSKDKAKRMTPVDLYIGGKEHDLKRNRAVTKDTGAPVVISWEKMSKSKHNGVDPDEMFQTYGTDTTRLLILADVSPTSHRNWNSNTFPGILNWQKRLWLTIRDFLKHRTNLPPQIPDDQFNSHENYLFDSRNYYVKGTSFNYLISQQLSIAVSKQQGLTNSIRKAPPAVFARSGQFERALATQIIMLAPMAPCFSSEMWSGFVAAPNRLDVSGDIRWDKSVFEQKWPETDMEYDLDLVCQVNGFENSVVKIKRKDLERLPKDEAIAIALRQKEVQATLSTRNILDVRYILHPGCESIVNILTDQPPPKAKAQEVSN